MSGELPSPQPEDDNDDQNNDNNPSDVQEDFSEPLDPRDAIVAAAAAAEPEPEPQLPTSPAETPSTSNNALIMQIKILSEYAKDIKRSMNAVATAAGVHHEYVRRAVSNLVTAVVEHNGDIETLQEIYSEDNYALRAKEIHRLLILVDNLVNRNQSLEDSNDNGSQQKSSNEGSINRHYNNNSRNSRMRNSNNPYDYYGYGQQSQQEQQQQPQQQEEDVINDLSTNAQLLKEVLQNQKNASPTNIQKTLRLFMLDEHTFINQPSSLSALHSMFNPVTATGAFNLFMQMRPKFVQQPAGGMPNGSGIPTYNLGDPQYLMHGGAEGYAARLAYEERREMLEDKRFDKYMRNMMMVNMQKKMGAQSPMIGDAGMGAIEEEQDEKGRVIRRRFVPQAAPNAGGMSDGMLRVIGEQNKILLQSQMDQLREMKDMFNSVLKNSAKIS